MKKVMLTLILLAALFVVLFTETNLTSAYAQVANRNTNEELTAAQLEKLNLEIAELKRKESIPFLLNQPVFLTLITLLAGGYIFSRVNERKARRDKRLEKAIEFIDEIGKDLNATLTVIFRYIRLGNYEGEIIESYEEKERLAKNRKEFLSDLEQKVPTLFAKRLSVEIKSKTFLKDKQFSIDYNDLVREIERIFQMVRRYKDSNDIDAYLTKINENRARFKSQWPLKEKIPDRKLKPPFKQLNDWTEMIWSRTVSLLSSVLKTSLK
jgi:hypothetical protein